MAGSIRKLKSGKYQARYTFRGVDIKGPHTFIKKRQAEAWLNEEFELISRGEWTHPEERQRKAEQAAFLNSLTVANWLERYHQGLLTRPNPIRRSTLGEYLRTTQNRITDAKLPDGNPAPIEVTFLATMPIANVTRSDIYRWWDGICNTYPDTHQTNQKAYKRLRAAFSAAMDRDLINTNPVQIKEATGRVRTKDKYLPSTEEINAIINEMADDKKMITSMALRHGIRIGEALGVETSDILIVEHPDRPAPYLPDISVRIRQNLQRNSHQGHIRLELQDVKTEAGRRSVPILDIDKPIYIRHLSRHSAGQQLEVPTGEATWTTIQPATVTEKGNLMLDTSFRSILNRAKLRAEVDPRITPHCGRNWFITRLAELGAHPQEIGKILGQHDMETILQIYLKVRGDRIPQLIASVNESIRNENAKA